MLKSLLQRLSSDEITLDEAARELDTTVRGEPRTANAALAMIKVARGAGQLSEVSYSRLYYVVQGSLESQRLAGSAPQRGGGGEEEPDETVIAGAAQRGGPAEEADDAGGEEETVLAPAMRRPRADSGGAGAAPPADAGTPAPADEGADDGAAEPAAPSGEGVDSPMEQEAADQEPAPPAETDEDEEDEDEEDDEDAPTVIARIARQRYSSHAAAEKQPAEKAAEPQRDADAGADEAGPDERGGAADEWSGAAAEEPDDEPDEDDDDEDAPTVIARLARSRYASNAASRGRQQDSDQAQPAAEEERPSPGGTGDGSSADSGAGGGVDLPLDTAAPAAGRSESAGGSAEPRRASPDAARRGPPPRTGTDEGAAGQAGAGESQAGGDAGAEADDDDDDDEAPTVVARIARQRYSSAAREIGREVPEDDAPPKRRQRPWQKPGGPARPTPEQPAARQDQGRADAGGGDEEATQIDPTAADAERTVVATGAAPPPAGGDTDRGSDSAADSGSGSGSGSQRSGSTISHTSQRSWTPPGASDETPELKGLGPGSVIKDRFVLEKVLGAGGMGKVYQASDQLKVEARDRNPHVALKVLTEDFKEHPEAFIALQRESSRQQRLAHPNIATVYDFDRIGRSGTQVFITMELMEGYPLNTYIKKIVRPRGGLPPEEAIPMVAQLGAALAYAHKRDIVHSDFKPGNAFLCDDGTLKVLDFGIARAVKAPGSAGGGGEGEGGSEQTYFDPGQLGALTPAYASLEMLEGESPDPRDDIYALACVAYELLTGHHPYNRKSAAKAKAGKLVPTPIKSLKRRQMRGLLRGLAFERENRSPDVETFVEELEGRLNWHKNPYVIGGAMAVALVVASTGPILSWLEERRIQQMVAQVQTGESEQIEAILADLDGLEPTARTTITDEARSTLQTYFEERVRDAVDPEQDRYDFSRAETELARAEEIYPDSASMIQLSNYLDAARDRRLNDLNQQFVRALEEDRLLPEEGSDDAPAVPTVLGQIEDISPDHSLLQDPRIPSAYANAAQGAINTGNLEQAHTYLDTGDRLIPDDIDLLNTRARLESAEAQQRRLARVDELRARFDDELEEMDSLDAFRDAEEAIVELARIAPDDPALAALRETAAPIAGERVAELEDAGTASTKRFVDTFAPILEALDLHEPLVRARTALAGSGEGGETREDIASEAEQRLADALAEPAFDRTWEANVRTQLRYLQAALPEDGGARLEQARDDIAGVYVERATELEEDQLYSEALALLGRAQALGLDRPEVAETHAEVDAAQTEFLEEREEAARQARIEGLKETLIIQARAQDLDAATDTYRELEPQLDNDDPFLTVAAPDALGEAFQTVAEEQAEDGDYRAALETVERGREFAPNDRTLNDDRQEYTVEVNTRELERIFTEEVRFDTARAGRMIDEIRTWAPARYSQVESNFVNVLVERIHELADDSRSEAERLATRASNVFPASSHLAELREELAPRPWPEGSAARAAVSAGRLNEAEAILERGLAERPDHPEVLNFQEELEDRKADAEAAFDSFRASLDAEELADARRYLSDARSLWVDNREFRDAQSELSEQIAEYRRQQSRVLQRSQDIEGLRAASETSGQDIVEEDWDPIPSTRPCTEGLAGHGPRARAICYDLIHNRVRGPLMVVVPNNNTFDSFAISKYEISNDDYNKYCFLSGNCAVDDDINENLPRVGLGLDEMREYAEWLSERTGKDYRLPTESEWEYAASANGEQPSRDFNCRVTLGSQALKGTDLVDVTVGQQNGWGLKNYIGNAQELVLANGDPLARGGAYRDPHSQCSLEFEREHDGQGSPVTGFRLILEDVEIED